MWGAVTVGFSTGGKQINGGKPKEKQRSIWFIQFIHDMTWSIHSNPKTKNNKNKQKNTLKISHSKKYVQ